MTGRVDIVWRMVEKTAKRFRMKWITGTEKRRIWFIHLKTLKKNPILCPVTSILTFFLQFSQNCARLYVYIDPSGNFVLGYFL
jgi:hypothetical protein